MIEEHCLPNIEALSKATVGTSLFIECVPHDLKMLSKIPSDSQPQEEPLGIRCSSSFCIDGRNRYQKEVIRYSTSSLTCLPIEKAVATPNRWIHATTGVSIHQKSL